MSETDSDVTRTCINTHTKPTKNIRTKKITPAVIDNKINKPSPWSRVVTNPTLAEINCLRSKKPETSLPRSQHPPPPPLVDPES